MAKSAKRPKPIEFRARIEALRPTVEGLRSVLSPQSNIERAQSGLVEQKLDALTKKYDTVIQEHFPGARIVGTADTEYGSHVLLRTQESAQDIGIRESLMDDPITIQTKSLVEKYHQAINLHKEALDKTVGPNRPYSAEEMPHEVTDAAEMYYGFTDPLKASTSQDMVRLFDDEWAASRYALETGQAPNIYKVLLPYSTSREGVRSSLPDSPGVGEGRAADYATDIPARYVEQGRRQRVSGPQTLHLYHGSDRDFITPKGNIGGGELSIDRALGPHMSRDPVIAETFANVTGGNMSKSRIDSKGVYILPQDKELFDENEIQRDVLRVVLPRRKDLFISLYSGTTAIPSKTNKTAEEAGRAWEEMMKTGTVFEPGGGDTFTFSKELGFSGFAHTNSSAHKIEEGLTREFVGEYKKALSEMGYDVISYRNTAHRELYNASEKNSYVVLDQNIITNTIRENFAAGLPTANEAFDFQYAYQTFEKLAHLGLSPNDVLREYPGDWKSNILDGISDFTINLKRKSAGAIAAIRNAYFKKEPTPGTRVSIATYGSELDGRKQIERVLRGKAQAALLNNAPEALKYARGNRYLYEIPLFDKYEWPVAVVLNERPTPETFIGRGIRARQLASAMKMHLANGDNYHFGKLLGFKPSEIESMDVDAVQRHPSKMVGVANRFINSLSRSLQKSYAVEVDKYLRGERKDDPTPPTGLDYNEITNIKRALTRAYDMGDLFGISLNIGGLLGSYYAEDDENKKNLFAASMLGGGVFSRRFIGKMTPGMLRKIGELDVTLSKETKPVRKDDIRRHLVVQLKELAAAGEPVRNASEFLRQAADKITYLHNNRVNPPPSPPTSVTTTIPDELKIAENYQHDRRLDRPGSIEEGFISNLRTEERLDPLAESVVKELFATSMPVGAVNAMRRGVMHVDDILREARRVYPEVVSKAMQGEYGPGRAFNVEELAAMEAGLANFIKTKDKNREPWSKDDVRHAANLLFTMIGATAETGRSQWWKRRALDSSARVFAERIRAHLDDTKLLGLLDKYVGDEIPPPGMIDYIVSFARNMKLASTSAVIRSIGGNSIMQGLKLAEMGPVALADRTLASLTGKPRDRYLVENTYYKSGVLSALPRAARDAVRVIKGEEFATLFERELIHRLQTIPGKFGKIVETPQRLQGAADVLFRHAAEEGHLWELSAREGMNAGKRGDDLQYYVNDKVKEFKELIQVEEVFRPEWVRRWNNDIVKYSERLTFQSKLGRIGGTVNAIRRRFPLTQIQIPFFNTWANLFKRVVEYTPLAVMTQEFRNGLMSGFAEKEAKGYKGEFYKELEARADKTGEPIDVGIGQLSDSIGRMATGTMLGIGTYLLVYKALDGEITGNGPVNKDERQRWLELGGKPYSIRLGNRLFGYRGWEPVSSWLSFIANAVEGYSETGSPAAAAWNVGKNLSADFAENPFLLGATDIVDAMRGETDVPRMLGGIATAAVIPNIIRQVNRVIDPVIRDPENTFTGELIKAIPGASTLLPARRGMIGQELSIQNPILRLFALDISTLPDDKVLNELRILSNSLGKTYGLVGDVISGIPLDKKTHNELVRISGEGFANAIRPAIENGSWAQLSDGEKDQFVTLVMNRIRDGVRAAYFRGHLIQGQLEKLRPFLKGGRFDPSQTDELNQQLDAILNEVGVGQEE
jgi:hypothetical protein